MPDGLDIITVTASILAASTAFSGILYFIIDFVFYCNFGSKYVT